MHPVISRLANTSYRRRIMDLLIRQNVNNDWVSATDLVSWALESNCPAMDSGNERKQRWVLNQLRMMHWYSVSLDELFDRPKGELGKVDLLQVKEEAGENFYRLNIPELIEGERDCPSLLESAEAVVRGHDASLVRRAGG